MALFRRRQATKSVQDEAPSVTTGPDWPDHDTAQEWLTHDYSRLYRRQPAVRTVVDFLANSIAQLTPKVYERIANDDRRELDDHPLAVLLRNPNPKTTQYRLLRDTTADRLIYDRAYWLKDKVPFPTAVARIPIPKIQRRTIDSLTGATAYYSSGGQLIPRELLVVFSGYTPDGDWSDEDGVAPLETLRLTLAEEWAAQQHRRNFWRNAARREGVIQRPLDAPEWSDLARARFRAGWENVTAGASNAGRTPVLEDGMTWVGDSFNAQESDYIEGRRLTFEEVCRQYRVAPKLFGVGDTQNANVETYHRQLYQDTLGPSLAELEQDIELQVLTDFSRLTNGTRIYVEFNLAGKLKGSFEEQLAALTTAVGVPWLARNEARSIQNLPRLAGGQYDYPITPLNVSEGGQPAANTPSATPATPPTPPGLPGPTPGKAKSSTEVPAAVLARRNAAARAHELIYQRNARAIEQSYKTKTRFDIAPFTKKLTAALWKARTQLAGETGARAARQIGGTYNPDFTLNWLEASARSTATNVNDSIVADLDASDDVDGTFALAKTAGAARLGISTATEVINWARNEAARQSSAEDGRTRTKTWIVTSQKSRHPELNGETVNFDDTFSNGARWPGDIDADVDETAGCQCLLQLG